MISVKIRCVLGGCDGVRFRRSKILGFQDFPA
jgi:hypothetical protein